jgi:hypothetical protein
MKKFFENLKLRIVRHWQTTLKGIIYAVLLVMYWQGKIDTTEWITATGAILTLNSIFLQKDADKVETKPEHKE